MKEMVMDEKQLEQNLCDHLRRCLCAPSQAEPLTFARTTSAVTSFTDLLGGVEYDVIQDDNRWNPAPQFMQDIAGNMIPDIVLRSRRSAENRIYVEVKRTRRLGYGKADSQIVRYLLHLLATTREKPVGDAVDIRRAVILAAPTFWFADSKNADTWGYFLTTYAPLAAAFDVTLAELHLSDESSNPPMQLPGSARN
jgi:hypothetical protein